MGEIHLCYVLLFSIFVNNYDIHNFIKVYHTCILTIFRTDMVYCPNSPKVDLVWFNSLQEPEKWFERPATAKNYHFKNNTEICTSLNNKTYVLDHFDASFLSKERYSPNYDKKSLLSSPPRCILKTSSSIYENGSFFYL